FRFPNPAFHFPNPAFRFPLPALSSQLSAFSSQLPALSSQLSAFSFQLSALSFQLSALSFLLPVFVPFLPISVCGHRDLSRDLVCYGQDQARRLYSFRPGIGYSPDLPHSKARKPVLRSAPGENTDTPSSYHDRSVDNPDRPDFFVSRGNVPAIPSAPFS